MITITIKIPIETVELSRQALQRSMVLGDIVRAEGAKLSLEIGRSEFVRAAALGMLRQSASKRCLDQYEADQEQTRDAEARQWWLENALFGLSPEERMKLYEGEW